MAKTVWNYPPARWTCIGAIANLAVYAGFEWLRPTDLSFDGLWAARGAVWTGLLLLDTLVVVWWYAQITSEIHRLAATNRREANKPFAIIARQGVPSTNLESSIGVSVPRHVLRNVGAGLAVNVYFAVAGQHGRVAITSIGALAAADQTPLPLYQQHVLDQREGYVRQVVVVAEGLETRTTRWNATINVLLPTGEIRHAIAWGRSVRYKHGESLQDWLNRTWPELARRMDELVPKPVPVDAKELE